MFTRRSFLQSSSLLALAPTVPLFVPRSLRAAAPDKDGRVLVVVELVDHQRTVALAHQPMNEIRHCGEQERLVVAGDEVNSHPVQIGTSSAGTRQ